MTFDLVWQNHGFLILVIFVFYAILYVLYLFLL